MIVTTVHCCSFVCMIKLSRSTLRLFFLICLDAVASIDVYVFIFTFLVGHVSILRYYIE